MSYRGKARARGSTHSMRSSTVHGLGSPGHDDIDTQDMLSLRCSKQDIDQYFH
jgi:hypothetical protein